MNVPVAKNRISWGETLTGDRKRGFEADNSEILEKLIENKWRIVFSDASLVGVQGIVSIFVPKIGVGIGLRKDMLFRPGCFFGFI